MSGTTLGLTIPKIFKGPKFMDSFVDQTKKMLSQFYKKNPVYGTGENAMQLMLAFVWTKILSWRRKKCD